MPELAMEHFMPPGFVSTPDARRLVNELLFGRTLEALRQKTPVGGLKDARLEALAAATFNQPLSLYHEDRHALMHGVDQLLTKQFRESLYVGKVFGYFLVTSGELLRIPQHIWGSSFGADTLRAGSIDEVELPETPLRGKVIFHTDDIRDYCDDKFVAPRCSEPSLHSYAPTQGSKRINATGSGSQEADNYVPPFIAFMLQAASQLGLKGDVRTPTSDITEWIKANWPPHLGSMSNHKVAGMVTLLRRPEDGKGGNTRYKVK